ncbi:MAG: hypothetical protein P4L33_05710 [Capsulimonadaceae bacterium]|nr:hypothetical protein [Capsulimonadaceae bacterium]
MKAIDLERAPSEVSLLNIILRVIGIGVVVVITIMEPLIGVAILYALGYLILAFRRPDIAILLVFASSPFQYDLSAGGAFRFSIAEINLVLTFVALVMLRIVDHRRVKYGPAFLPVLLYLAVCAIASVHDMHNSSAYVALLQMFLYLVVAVIVFSQFLPKQQTCMLALRGAVVVSVFLAIAQALNPGDYVLGLHKNGIGASLSCGLIIAVDLWFAEKDVKRKRLLLASLIVITLGLISGLSRGAWLAAAAGCGVLTIVRREYLLLARGAVIVGLVFMLVWSRLPSQYQEYTVGFDPGRQNIALRLNTIGYTQQLFRASPLIGNGIAIRKDIDATNLFWITLAETGVIGLTAFLFMHAALLYIFFQGLRIVPRDSAYASIYSIASALLIAHFAHGLVDHYWSRGALMMVWAAVGMAIGVTLRLGPTAPLRPLGTGSAKGSYI